MIFNLNLWLIFLEILYFSSYNNRIKITFGKKHKILGATKNQGEIIFLFLTFFQLAVLLCLRAKTVGVDTQSYLDIYHYCCSGLDISYLEKGAQFYIWFLSQWGEHDRLFLIAFAIPTMILNYRFIWKYSDNVYMSVFIFAGLMYYFLMFNIMRQSLAMAIALQAIQPMIERKWGKFICIIIFAGLFHKSAWIFLALSVIPFIKVKINVGYIAGAVVGILFLLCTGGKILRGILKLAGSSYAHYLDDANYGGSGNALHPIMYFLIFCLVVLLWKNIEDRADYIMVTMLLIGTMLFALSITIKAVNRLPYYYTAAVIVLLPNLIGKGKSRRMCLYLTAGVYFCVALYEIMLVARNAQGILPYKFFWEI